ncbi:hypothetical protein VVD49_13040 [Uliginosibacterium sp. H3]|uniref:Uncharacterized protein n=1 Tax=Uliginosibacterium silvisoli TaxID=3114758 RepID=A0ABU6K6N4_9RHOO|nr:hypothetical protein [Uliginosibacterium sp. H3]
MNPLTRIRMACVAAGLAALTLSTFVFVAKASTDLSQTIKLDKPARLPTKQELLVQQVNDLSDRLAALESKIGQQQKALDKANEQINARPQGYHRAFITLANFNHLPATDGISYWAKD